MKYEVYPISLLIIVILRKQYKSNTVQFGLHCCAAGDILPGFLGDFFSVNNSSKHYYIFLREIKLTLPKDYICHTSSARRKAYQHEQNYS